MMNMQQHRHVLVVWLLICLATNEVLGGAQQAGPCKAEPNYSAICVVARDENRYIREWVHYHQCLGVDHIYLYDHNSVRPMNEEIQDYISSGYVTYHSNISGLSHTKYKEGFSSNLERFMTTIQGQVYKDCLDRYGSAHQFIGFIDIDEFVVLHQPADTNINCFLSGYAASGGVSMYWVVHGSSGHQVPPQQPAITAFTSCAPLTAKANTQFKSWVNMAARPTMYSPHRAVFEQSNAFLVNELGQPIPAGRNPNSTHHRVSVYHYATRSRHDFMAKRKRGGGAGVTRPAGYLDRLDARCTSSCHDAVHTYLRTCAAQSVQMQLDVAGSAGAALQEGHFAGLGQDMPSVSNV